MKTIAIVIGVSNYQDPAFKTIPGAALDAERFSTAFASWGIPKDWIHLLLNEEATKANVIKTLFNCRSSFDKDAKLIFYFAGHGVRDNFIHHETPESSLALHDTLAEDSLFTGLRLIELMQLIRRLKPIQVFLFIDACSLRLNHITNPLNDGDILSTTNSGGLFCLFSSGTRQSYEDGFLKYGYFTKALLKSISELRHDETSTCQDIVKKVSKSLQEKSLPIPEVYHIGYEKMWPLEHYYEHDRGVGDKHSHKIVMRESAVAKLQDHLVTTPDPVIWMWGESGMGKSVIAEQLNKRNGSAFYASIPNISANYGTILHIVIEQIRAQKSELFFNRPFDSSLYNTLNHIISFHPGSIFILDQLDRLLTSDLEDLISELDCVPIPCILISRYPCPNALFKSRSANLIDVCAASLHFEEIEQLVVTNGYDASFSNVLLNVSQGNVLKARQMLVKLSSTEIPLEGRLARDYINTMTGIVVCGGVLDEILFCQVFKCKSENFVILEKLGLIHYTKEGCFPHDQLVAMVEEGNWPLDIEKGCQYWNLQIQHTPYNQWACRSLVLMASQLQKCTHLKISLSQCLETLNEQQNVQFLFDLVEIFKKEKWEELLLQSTEYLINHEEYQLSGEILDELSRSDKPSIKKNAALNNAKRLVCLGHAHECIKLYGHMVNKSRSPEFVIPLRNALGISYFFLGELDEAMDLFQATIKCKESKKELSLGIADFMAGLIMTYRGESIFKAKELIERSLQIFECLKNYLWVAIGLNGLAELSYRLERWHQSFHCLHRAHEILQAINNKTFLLYTIKNMARVYLRLDPNHRDLSTLVLKMENFLKETKKHPDTWMTMWIQNTLATVYAYWNEIHKLKMIMKDVAPKTIENLGCHIYTMSNLGHLASLEKDYENANYYYKQSKVLAEQTKNQLAIQEIKHHIIGCSSEAFPTLSKSCSVG